MTTITTTVTREPAQARQELTLADQLFQTGLFEGEAVRDWESTFNGLRDPQDRAVALTYLLFKFIHPSIVSNPERAEQLLGLEDQVRDRLRALLPREISVDQYIEARNREQAQVDQIARIEQLFQEQMGRAQEINQQMIEKFEELKRRLQSMYSQNVTENNALNARIETMIERINAAQTQIEGKVSEINQHLIKQQKNSTKNREV